jgi:peroxiredoxin
MFVSCIAALGLLAATGCESSAQGKSKEAEAVESKKDESKESKGSKTKKQAQKSDESSDSEKSGSAAKTGDSDDSEKGMKKAVVGEPAPDFKLEDETGEVHQLSDHEGKTVVLEWTNPDCPYVERHYNKAETMTKTMKKLGGAEKVAWLTVDSTHSNTPKESEKWKKKQGFDYPILQDKEGQVGKIYGAKTTPHMYVIDKEGVLRYKGAIDDDPRGKKDYEKRTNYVTNAVMALRNGKDVSPKTTDPYGCSVKYEGK